MRPLSLLTSLLLAAASVQAANPPWIRSRNYDPKKQATKVRSALEKRASSNTCDVNDPLNPCFTDPNGNTVPVCFWDMFACCVAPTPGRRRSHIPGQLFVGDILDPPNAVKFLLSETGTYTHSNGTVIVDHFYDKTRRNQIYRSAKRGLLGRMVENSVGVFVKVLPKTHFAESLYRDYFAQKDTILAFSTQTAIDLEDVPEVIDLLLQRDDWDHIKVHAIRVEREAIEHLGNALRTDWMDVDDL